MIREESITEEAKGATASRGFTLVEVLVALVLTGMVAAVAGFFMSAFMNSYIATRTGSEGALKAEMALDRIRTELKEISTVHAFNADTSIQYTTRVEQAGTQVYPNQRTLRYASPYIYIDYGGNSRVLLNNVEAFALRIPGAQGGALSCHRDIDNVTGEEVACVDISITITGLPAFSTRIFPRRLVAAPAGL